MEDNRKLNSYFENRPGCMARAVFLGAPGGRPFVTGESPESAR